MHALGLPAFIYGAGLNLFNISVFAYFMNSLGAYKVDRRKMNMIYLETLKTYSNIALQHGIHSLFFPGGTRSRSGMIETKLKLGLLGTAMEAQRNNFEKSENNDAKKIFVVPIVLNYNLVLEAAPLISDYLRREGQERYYVENDNYSNSYRILSFLVRFITKGSNIAVSIGRGMDLLGNYVDDEGNSLDATGKHIDIRDYFSFHGKIERNVQRESEYTRMLSEKLVKEFHALAIVLPGHFVTFVAFEKLRRRHPRLDIYNFLRMPVEEQIIDYNEFNIACASFIKVLFDLERDKKIQTADYLKEQTIDDIIETGINNVGILHAKRPLLKNKEGNIITNDLNLLYYYHNRLAGYELEKYI
ncbi:1-acyl-sn-glycerol-3-phosphate acyltransferase [Bacteroidota bacterium]